MLGADIGAEGQVTNNALSDMQQPMDETQSSPMRRDDGSMDTNLPGADGARYYTIQRVNGNGANGKGDGTTGGHRHSLEDSDKIKKNSIHRHYIKEDKERRKSTVSVQSFPQSMRFLFTQSERITDFKAPASSLLMLCHKYAICLRHTSCAIAFQPHIYAKSRPSRCRTVLIRKRKPTTKRLPASR